MYALEAKGLVKFFPSKRGLVKAVDGVSLRIKQGEIFGLLGVNGAGKSTIINILSGLIIPDAGEIKIFSKDFFEHGEEIREQFNLATAYYHLSHNLTILQNLKVYARLYNVKNSAKKIEELSKKFMIWDLRNTQVKSLSSGEKTKLVLVKSLLNDPKLLFLDECTVGLDPDIAEVTRKHLLDYNRDSGCTIIFTSHYMHEVERMCDRIAFMDRGRIVKIGDAQDLIKELETQKVRIHFSKKIEKAKQILKREKIDFLEEGKGIFKFKIQNREKVIYPLLEKFVKADIPFDDLHLNKPTLEEYFIRKSNLK